MHKWRSGNAGDCNSPIRQSESDLVLSLIREKQKFIMKEGFYINNLELEKTLRKIGKINKENYDTLRAREDRKLRVKVRKYIKKVENKDEDGAL